MTMYYTYLLKCLPTNEFYYGVKYASDSDPDTFWVNYFTSSNRVSTRIRLFGKSAFLFEIRKTFNCPKAARIWEDRVLRKLKVLNRSDFLNESYGCMFDNRGTIKGRKMMYFFDSREYHYVDKSLIPFLLEKGLAIVKGKPKPNDFGQKISTALTGKPKSAIHIANNADSQRGKLRGTYVEQYGEKRAREIIEKTVGKKAVYYLTHRHPSNGKTYEEIYGKETAIIIKRQRSKFLKENNPGHKMKNKTYEELYGTEKANRLKANRSKSSSIPHRIYNVFYNGMLLYSGNRLDSGKFLQDYTSSKNKDVLYDIKFLEKRGIKVETLPAPR